jgi:hypothetical protein
MRCCKILKSIDWFSNNTRKNISTKSLSESTVIMEYYCFKFLLIKLEYTNNTRTAPVTVPYCPMSSNADTNRVACAYEVIYKENICRWQINSTINYDGDFSKSIIKRVFPGIIWKSIDRFQDLATSYWPCCSKLM